MAHTLEPFCNTIQTSIGASGGPTHVARQLFKYTPQDLVISISFPRYANDVIELTKQMQEKGVPVLALTDAPSSPLAAHANVTLFAQTRRQFAPNSEASALSLIESICAAVAHQAKSPVHAASEMTKFMLPWLHQETEAKPDKPENQLIRQNRITFPKQKFSTLIKQSVSQTLLSI